MCVAHDSDSGIDGYVLHRRGHNLDTHLIDGTLTVVELLATNPVAEASPWRFCFDADLMVRTAAHPRPAIEDLGMFLVHRRWLEIVAYDGLYVRLLDLPAALEGRGYTQGYDGTELVFDVTDALLPRNQARWQVSVHGDGVEVRRTLEDPHLRIDTSDLATAYLGRPHFAALARVGRIEECVAGAAVLADRMFAGERPPWCPMYF